MCNFKYDVDDIVVCENKKLKEENERLITIAREHEAENEQLKDFNVAITKDNVNLCFSEGELKKENARLKQDLKECELKLKVTKNISNNYHEIAQRFKKELEALKQNKTMPGCDTCGRCDISFCYKCSFELKKILVEDKQNTQSAGQDKIDLDRFVCGNCNEKLQNNGVGYSCPCWSKPRPAEKPYKCDTCDETEHCECKFQAIRPELCGHNWVNFNGEKGCPFCESITSARSGTHCGTCTKPKCKTCEETTASYPDGDVECEYCGKINCPQRCPRCCKQEHCEYCTQKKEKKHIYYAIHGSLKCPIHDKDETEHCEVSGAKLK